MIAIFKHWRVLFFAVMIYVIAYAVIVEEDQLQAVIQEEQQINYSYLGEDRAKAAEQRATNIFNTLFVKTSVVEKSFAIFIPSSTRQKASRGIETMGAPVFVWFEKRIRAVWTLVYQVLLRACTAVLWWPFFVLVGFPLLVDALVARKLKMMSFAITSPHFQGLAMRSIPLVVLTYLVILFAPVLVHPAWVPGVIFMTAGAAWVAVSQFVKRG